MHLFDMREVGPTSFCYEKSYVSKPWSRFAMSFFDVFLALERDREVCALLCDLGWYVFQCSLNIIFFAQKMILEALCPLCSWLNFMHYSEGAHLISVCVYVCLGAEKDLNLMDLEK